MPVCALPRRSEVPAVRAPAMFIQVWEKEWKKRGGVGGGWSWVAILLSRCIHKAQWADEWSHMVIFFPYFPTQTHPHPLPCTKPLFFFFSSALLQVFGETAAGYCSSIKLLAIIPPLEKKKKKEENLRHHACVPCLATSATAFTFRLTHSVVFFSFVLWSLSGFFDTLPSSGTVANWGRFVAGKKQNPNFFVCLVLLETSQKINRVLNRARRIKVCSFG